MYFNSYNPLKKFMLIDEFMCFVNPLGLANFFVGKEIFRYTASPHRGESAAAGVPRPHQQQD